MAGKVAQQGPEKLMYESSLDDSTRLRVYKYFPLNKVYLFSCIFVIDSTTFAAHHDHLLCNLMIHLGKYLRKCLRVLV